MNILPAPWTQKHQPGDSRGVRQGPRVRWGGGYTGAWLRRDALPMPTTHTARRPGRGPSTPSAPHRDPSLRAPSPRPGHGGLSPLLPLGPPLPGSRGLPRAPGREGWWLPHAAGFLGFTAPHPQFGCQRRRPGCSGADGKLAPPGDPSGRVCCPSSTAAGGLVQVGL